MAMTKILLISLVVLSVAWDDFHHRGDGDRSFGIVGVNAKVREECTVQNDGEVVCTKKFRIEDFDDLDDEGVEEYPEEDEVSGCEDKHENCVFWAHHGECEKNPVYMLDNCAESCDVCSASKSKDKFYLDRKQPIRLEKENMLELTNKFGAKQEAIGSDELGTLVVIRQSVFYMENFVMSERPTHTMSKDAIEACRNKEPLCSYWAYLGECENNKAFMRTNCGPACQTCDKIDYATRCPPRDENATPAWKPGELNIMFENIVNNDSLQVTVHSGPKDQQQQNGKLDPSVDLANDPWIITIDNFLTDEECDKLIELGHQNEFARSKDVSHKMNADGSYEGYENDRRTSKNAWCSELRNCRQTETAQIVHNKIADLTNIPAVNSEDFQILKYDVGEFYRKHHDFITHQKDRANGPRILTVFLYLSDVEEGGGTAFPDLNHVVEPRKGRALLWPSVLNSDPNSSDDRMMHEALEVIKGTKFAANAWIHLYDNVTPTRNGCT